MVQQALTILVGTWCFSCVEPQAVINPSDLKIYVNNSQDLDAVASDLLPFGSDELLIFGVCGSSRLHPP